MMDALFLLFDKEGDGGRWVVFILEILSVFAGLMCVVSDNTRQVNPRLRLAVNLVLQKCLLLIHQTKTCRRSRQACR